MPSKARTDQPDDEHNDELALSEGLNGGGSSVLRWKAKPVDVEEVAERLLPMLLVELIGNFGCRVMIGLTEDLTSWFLRVYSGDKSLAVFPKTITDWAEVAKWATGPDVLDDVIRHGEVIEQRDRRKRRV